MLPREIKGIMVRSEFQTKGFHAGSNETPCDGLFMSVTEENEDMLEKLADVKRGKS